MVQNLAKLLFQATRLDRIPDPKIHLGVILFALPGINVHTPYTGIFLRGDDRIGKSFSLVKIVLVPLEILEIILEGHLVCRPIILRGKNMS